LATVSTAAGSLHQSRKTRKLRSLVAAKAADTMVKAPRHVKAESAEGSTEENAVRVPAIGQMRQWNLNKIEARVDYRTQQLKEKMSNLEIDAGKDNVAFLYIKPQANNAQVKEFVQQRFAENKMEIVDSGVITGDELMSRRVIERHYSSLSKKALRSNPDKLCIPAAAQSAFEEAFGLSWQEALDQKLVLNLRTAMEKFDCTPEELDAEWDTLELGKGKLKFGGGFYCGKMWGHYVINGFYIALQNMYAKPETQVTWFVVKWSPEDLSWKEFRENLVGEVDPAKAPVGSLRRDVYDAWREMGLEEQPNTSGNVIHGSASPVEAVWERWNWLGLKLASDPMASSLRKAAVLSQTDLLRWGTDPLVSVKGECERTSLYDMFENHDSPTCLERSTQVIWRRSWDKRRSKSA